MAEVWLVRDRELDEEVAAKIVPPGAGEETIALLRRECQNARRLAHPNIVRVFDFHRGKERSFITMAYVEGDDLTRLRGGKPAEIVKVLAPIAAALGYAHELGVIHRDLKVDNVLCDGSGKPHVLDFGISAVLARDDRLSVSGSGSRNGMSPQQLDGAEPGPADDIYAFGALLYELVTGHPPLWPEVTEERIRSVAPDPMRSSYPLPARLQTLAARLLEKPAADRPRDMAEVGSELSAILSELEQAPAARTSKDAIRLTPPPRAAAVRPVAPQSPPVATPRATPADPRRRNLVIAASIIFPLALVALLVFVFLPGWVEKSRSQATNADDATIAPAPITETPAAVPDSTDSPDAAVPPPATPALPSSGELRAQAARREAAREALERASGFRSRLEERGAGLWAAEGFAAAQQTLSEADAQLTVGAYADAESLYNDALHRLETIAASGPEVLRRLLEEGRSALAAGDDAAATKAFTLAARIDPQSSAATTGLKRAGALDEVMRLLEAGARHEREGQTDLAEQSYRRAAALDPMSAEAQQSLARVQSRISNDAFARTMSEGLEALERGDYPAAREAFRRADQMRPGRSDVEEALLQVKQSQSLEAIVGHREHAQAAEAEEDWHTAAAQYELILALDGTIRFAQEGKARCSARAEMADLIDYHLANPGRLSTDDVFEEALELLVQASAVQPAGPVHRQRVEALERLLDAAGTPVPVILLSDLETEVVIYKVGRFGSFERREMTLRPGTYTVVGSRRGYRDVRLTLVVEAGAPPVPLTVKCEDPV